MLLRLKLALLYSPRSKAVAGTRKARVGLGQVAERWLFLERSYSVREQTSADGPWELHSSAKHGPGRGSAGQFPMGHQAWGAGELAAPGGKGAKKKLCKAAQCCDPHAWRKRGGRGPRGRCAGARRQAARQAVQCQQRARVCTVGT